MAIRSQRVKGLGRLFAELKRRNVFRVGIAYGITTWVLLQIVDVMSPLMALPEWAPRLIFLILAIGVFPALIFAWAFELTPEGLKREKDVDRSKSIAVLPFVNMSSDAEQEYFSDGITEEILNSLTAVKELKVAGRTSSFAFKGQNDDLRTRKSLRRGEYETVDQLVYLVPLIGQLFVAFAIYSDHQLQVWYHH